LHRPTAHINVVNAVVAHLARPGVPGPMPVVVQLLAPQGQLVSEAAPQVVIHYRRDRRWRRDLADAGALPVEKDPPEPDGTELAALDPGDGFLQGGTGSGLRSALDDAAILARGCDHLLAFPDVVRDRFLHIDVLSRLAGPNGGQRVPVV